MTNAYRAIKEQHMPVARAAAQFNVPETTLRQRALGRVDPETTVSGPAPVLSQEEEAVFVDHLKFMASVGYGYTRNEVINMASEYAVSHQKRDKDHPFSLKWFRDFMKRWPELSVTKPRSLSMARAKATSQEAVTNYFEQLKVIMTKHNLLDKPQHIYNVDEKGLQTEHTPPYVVGCKENPTPAITSARSSLTTVIGSGNALGTQIPQYFVFQGQRMRQELLAGCSAGANGTVTDSGWSNGQVFETYLNDHFLKYVQGRNKDEPILILFDGHRSHISMTLIDWAKENNVVLFVLPAHTSHALQPLDLGCFGPFQRIYNAECHKFIRDNPSSRVTRYNVCSIACKAYSHALSPENLKGSFRRSGIYPFDPSAVDSSQFVPATVFNNEQIPESTQKESSNKNELNKTLPSCSTEFFNRKTECIKQKANEEKKQRRNVSEIVSGKSITEDQTVEKLKDYQCTVSKRKLADMNEKSKDTCPKPIKNDSKQRKSKPVKKIKQVKKTNSLQEPQPGPSGIQKIPISDSDSDSSSENDTEKCCTCNRFQPEALRNCVSVIFVKWAQCDFNGCRHWTHLQFCCKQKVIRLGDQFICPCHHSMS